MAVINFTKGGQRRKVLTSWLAFFFFGPFYFYVYGDRHYIRIAHFTLALFLFTLPFTAGTSYLILAPMTFAFQLFYPRYRTKQLLEEGWMPETERDMALTNDCIEA